MRQGMRMGTQQRIFDQFFEMEKTGQHIYPMSLSGEENARCISRIFKEAICGVIVSSCFFADG